MADVSKRDNLAKRIVREDGQWCVRAKDTDRLFGCYDTEAEAEERLAQVEAFSDDDDDVDKRASTVDLDVTVTKRDDEHQLVFGFAKMADRPDGDGPYVDLQGDVVDIGELELAAYDYVLESRDAGVMHVTKGAGRLVESFVVTPDKLEKMGLPADAVPAGWWVGYRIDDDDAWALVKSGKLRAFSIEGTGTRTPVDLADSTVGKGYDVAYDDGPPLTEEQVADRRDLILRLFRASQITEPERDKLLQMLPPPREYVRLQVEQEVERRTRTLRDKLSEMFGLSASDDPTT